MQIIRSFTLLALLMPVLFGQSAFAAYVLQDNYTPANFFSMFNFFTGTDPTNGFVKYVDQATATNQGIIYSSSAGAYVGVDHTNVASSGRTSVRLQSKNYYTHGLFILDLQHMPNSICGTWPAFWTYGSQVTWPNQGEIDIIEGVHTDTYNHMALHTTDSCTVTGSGQTGSQQSYNCYVNAAGQSANQGCSVQSSSSSSYGTNFNAPGGGVYAMEWTSSAIKVWYWPRGSIPSDITNGAPVPSNWGTPAANFQGSCDIDSHFANHQIVFDITFCGDWAGNVWSQYSQCTALSSSCTSYVANNPSAFAETYWLVNSLKVYQQTSSSVVQANLRNRTFVW